MSNVTLTSTESILKRAIRHEKRTRKKRTYKGYEIMPAGDRWFWREGEDDYDGTHPLSCGFGKTIADCKAQINDDIEFNNESIKRDPEPPRYVEPPKGYTYAGCENSMPLLRDASGQATGIHYPLIIRKCKDAGHEVESKHTQFGHHMWICHECKLYWDMDSGD